MNEINLAAQEFFTIIDGNIDSIINDIFPLQYKQQLKAINYIINYLRSNKIPKLKAKNLLNELTEIEEAKNKFKVLKELSGDELEQVCTKTIEIIENNILQEIINKKELFTKISEFEVEQEYENKKINIQNKNNECNHQIVVAEYRKAKEEYLEKKYSLKLEANKIEEEKQVLIAEYKTELKNLNDKNLQDLQNEQINLRIGKTIDSVEKHKLVIQGVLTAEEIAPIIYSYELLNTLAAYNNGHNVAKLFDAARNFHLTNPAEGIAKLAEIQYQQVTCLLNNNILDLLEEKIINFNHLRTMNEYHYQFFIKSYSEVRNLKNSKSNTDKIITLISSKLTLDFLINAKFSLDQIIILTDLGFSLGQLFNIKHSKVELFAKNIWEVKNLIDSGFSAKQLLDMKDSKLDFFIKNDLKVKDLINSGFSTNELIEMKHFKTEFKDIKSLNSSFFLEKLFNIKHTKLKFFIEYSKKIQGLIDSGFSPSELIDMDYSEFKYNVKYYHTAFQKSQYEDVDISGDILDHL